MKIGIIIGSIRDGRMGEAIGTWVAQNAASHNDATFDIIDLKEFDLPFFSSETLPRLANKQYSDPTVQTFSTAIDSCDGFIFVTPEYNQSVPGAFKNAVDSLALEWLEKPVGLVGYSFHGAKNSRAHWHTILSGFSMTVVPSEVAINLGTDVVDGKFTPNDEQKQTLNSLLQEVTSAATK